MPDVTGEGQRIDEHTQRVGGAHVAAAVADGTHINLPAAAEGPDSQIGCSQIVACVGDAQVEAALRDVGADPLGEQRFPSGAFGLQVGKDAAGSFTAGHLPGEEVTRGGEGFTFPRFQLVLRVVEIGVVLRYGILAAERLCQLGDEDVVGAAVEYQVMEIREQVEPVAAAHHGNVVQRSFRQVERLFEMGFVRFELFGIHRLAFHVRGRVGRYLDYLAVACLEMRVQRGMTADQFLYRLADRLGTERSGECPHHRNVVDRLLRCLHAVEIDARLLECERLRRVGTVQRPALLGTLSGDQDLEHFVLDALQGGRPDEGIHVHLDAIFLVDLRGQAQCGERGKAVVDQRFGQGDAVDVDGFGDQVGNLLLQDVERRRFLDFLLRLLRYGFGQGLPVDLLIDGERDPVDLHRDGRHHVRRFLAEDVGVERLDVDRLVRHHVGGQELATAGSLVVESLDGHVVDAGEIVDHGLDFLEFDPESADLDLGILAAYELDVAVFPPADDVAGVIGPFVEGILFEGVFRENIGGFFGEPQVAHTDLRAGQQQLAGSADRQQLPVFGRPGRDGRWECSLPSFRPVCPRHSNCIPSGRSSCKACTPAGRCWPFSRRPSSGS